MHINKLIILSADLPVLATFALAAMRYKSLAPGLKVFAGFIFLSGIIHAISLVLWLNSTNNMPLLHIYVPAGFLLLAWFYSVILQGFINKTIIWFIAAVLVVYSVINTLAVQNVFTFNSNALTVNSILIIIFSLSVFILFLNQNAKESRKPILSGFNWINSGLFLYHSSSLLIFYFGTIITHSFSRNLNLYTWAFHSFFSDVMYICFFVGLWKQPRN